MTLTRIVDASPTETSIIGSEIIRCYRCGQPLAQPSMEITALDAIKTSAPSRPLSVSISVACELPCLTDNRIRLNFLGLSDKQKAQLEALIKRASASGP